MPGPEPAFSPSPLWQEWFACSALNGRRPFPAPWPLGRIRKSAKERLQAPVAAPDDSTSCGYLRQKSREAERDVSAALTAPDGFLTGRPFKRPCKHWLLTG